MKSGWSHHLQELPGTDHEADLITIVANSKYFEETNNVSNTILLVCSLSESTMYNCEADAETRFTFGRCRVVCFCSSDTSDAANVKPNEFDLLFSGQPLKRVWDGVCVSAEEAAADVQKGPTSSGSLPAASGSVDESPEKAPPAPAAPPVPDLQDFFRSKKQLVGELRDICEAHTEGKGLVQAVAESIEALGAECDLVKDYGTMQVKQEFVGCVADIKTHLSSVRKCQSADTWPAIEQAAKDAMIKLLVLLSPLVFLNNSTMDESQGCSVQ